MGLRRSAYSSAANVPTRICTTAELADWAGSPMAALKTARNCEGLGEVALVCAASGQAASNRTMMPAARAYAACCLRVFGILVRRY
jgi:hypothetical protein